VIPVPNLEQNNAGAPQPTKGELMEMFPEVKVNDFKRVVYNLLVESFNNPSPNSIVMVRTVSNFRVSLSALLHLRSGEIQRRFQIQ
jgi:hypothetical protein